MFGIFVYMFTRKVIIVVTIYILTKCAFTIDSDSGRVCSKLVPNPHSWHRDASLLYIDSPVSELLILHHHHYQVSMDIRCLPPLQRQTSKQLDKFPASLACGASGLGTPTGEHSTNLVGWTIFTVGTWWTWYSFILRWAQLVLGTRYLVLGTCWTWYSFILRWAQAFPTPRAHHQVTQTQTHRWHPSWGQPSSFFRLILI